MLIEIAKNLVIILSDNEYDYIHKKAAEKGISASKYARDIIFPEEDTFESNWNYLLNRLENYPVGADFDISIIMVPELWKSYDRSTKLSLVRTLSRKIADGSIDNAIVVGRS